MERLSLWLEKGSAALVFTPVARKYYTGFNSSLGFLLVTSDDSVLLVDGRYYLAAISSVKNCKVELLNKAFDQINEFLKKHNIETVLVENTITVAELDRIRNGITDALVLADGGLTEFTDELREVKTEHEVEQLVKAQGIAEKAFYEVLNSIKAGVSEREVAAELEYLMKKYGSEQPSFDTVAVSGIKSAMPHGVPDDKLLENGDFLTMDFGAVCDGYHSDMTRTVAIGFVTDKMHEVYNTVLSAMTAAEKKVKNGVSAKDIDAAARNVIAQKGYGEYFTHSTGHGIGLQIHELPNVSPTLDKPLKTGNVISDEPGIYIENEFGVRVEDMLLVTENGCINLTKAEKSIIIL